MSSSLAERPAARWRLGVDPAAAAAGGVAGRWTALARATWLLQIGIALEAPRAPPRCAPSLHLMPGLWLEEVRALVPFLRFCSTTTILPLYSPNPPGAGD